MASARTIRPPATGEGIPAVKSPPLARGLLRLAVIVVAMVILRLAHLPASDVVIPVLAILVPWALWARLVSTRLGVAGPGGVGLGLAVSLSGWSAAEFLALLCHSGVNLASSLAVLAVLSGAPALTLPTTYVSPQTVARTRVLIEEATPRAGLLALLPFVAGAALVASSMRLSRQDHPLSVEFAVFTAGTLLMFAPTFFRSPASWSRLNAPVLLFLSLGAYLPYWLRSPSNPAVTDEIAHWGETLQMMQRGRLFLHDNVVTMGTHFPGLETLFVGPAQLDGNASFTFARVLVLLFHTASVLGVYELARLTFGKGATAAAMFAATLYAINPSFLLIDSWFSYESFAVPLVIWGVVAILRYAAATDLSRAWLAISSLITVAIVITHHLSSYALAGSILVLLLFAVVPRLTVDRSEYSAPSYSVRRLLGFALVLIVSSVAWAVVTRAPVLHYLLVFPKSAGESAYDVLTGRGLASSATASTASGRFNGTRSIFENSSFEPAYERVASVAAQLLLLLWFIAALRKMWPVRTAVTCFLAFLGALYFISLPFTTISGAGQGVHRSWAFSFIGLALTLPHYKPIVDARRAARSTASWRPSVLTGVFLLILLVGNYGSSVSVFYRFPGKFVLGADGRTYSPDMIRSAEWFRANVGSNVKISATSRDFIIFGSYADAEQANFNGWNLLFPTSDPGTEVWNELRASGTKYVVLDTRVSQVPNVGQYFQLWEPLPQSSPLPGASVQKYLSIPWLTLVHSDDNTEIFKVSS